MKDVLILAGGFGTRLRSVIGESQKALAEINGIPMLYYQIHFWISNGATRLILLLHYKAELVIDYIENQKRVGAFGECEIEYCVENSPLGTGGAIVNAVGHFEVSQEFIVFNADTWLSGNLTDFIKTSGNVIGVTRCNDCSRYGTVEFNDTGQVLRFKEKTVDSLTGWINAGVYKFKKEVFSEMKIQNYSLEIDILPDLIANMELLSVPILGEFCDIGIPSDYAELQLRLLEKDKT